MSRNFDFSQAAGKGITVLPDITLGLPTVGDVLSVAATTGGVVTTTFAAPGSGSVAGVASFNTRTGTVTLTSGDVTTALTFTPYNATNPANYTTKTYVDSSITTAIAAIPAPPAARNTARLQAQWVTSAIVANDTVYFAYDAPYNGTVNSLKYFTGNGSFTVAVQINGTNVTGLSAVAVSSATPATATATAANTFSAGQRITAVITVATGSPTDALLSLAVTWS